MAMDTEEMKDFVESPDSIEGLACKYMQKCIVESSTESESESSVEVVPSTLAGRLKKARDTGGLQFLDPYDGDSEDESVPSDCSLNTSSNLEVARWAKCAPKAAALEDADTLEEAESFPEPPEWLCSETKVTEIQAVKDCKAPLELPSQQDFPRSLLQSSELPRATEAFTSMRLTPENSLLMSINPSASADLPASSDDSAPQTIVGADCDGTVAKQPLLKRKQRVPIPEGASEKLGRKKFCVSKV
ncbi:uncharacterized protein [Melopsittacus undulatus]|uniref:uncharacterized protein n=1 Tax=Melopsittacus undulatus TaxID=13146 RepID=UPI00146E788B|nr:uncharacterized protein LOC115946591 [Melopsittacus undulatus]